MRIAVIGAGNVGAALGQGWAAAGHQVTYGVRDPVRSGPAPRATVAAAAQGAEAVVLATPWPATEAAIRAAGELNGKIVIDCTNPLRMGAAGLELALGHTDSGGEQVARWAPGAAVFKAFNTVGYGVMAEAGRYGPPKPLMLVAGDDAQRKPDVLGLAADLGFDAVDAGPLRAARLLEAYGMTWIHLALTRGLGRDFAFAIVRRGS